MRVSRACGFLALWVTSLWCGCLPRADLEYDLRPWDPAIKSRGVTVAVAPVEDCRRPNEGGRVGAQLLVLLIPLWPYASFHENRFELDGGQWDWQLTDILDYELSRLGFSTVVGSECGRSQIANCDLSFRTKVMSLGKSGWFTCYGLAFVGGCLGFLGLPLGGAGCQAEIQFSLEDKSGDVVWSYAFAKETGWSATGFYYGKHLNSAEGLYDLVRDAINQALDEMCRALDARSDAG